MPCSWTGPSPEAAAVWQAAVAHDRQLCQLLCCCANFCAAVQLNSDLAGLLDEWATSLFRELDYRREARNGARFSKLYRHMQAGLRGSHGSAATCRQACGAALPACTLRRPFD